MTKSLNQRTYESAIRMAAAVDQPAPDPTAYGLPPWQTPMAEEPTPAGPSAADQTPTAPATPAAAQSDPALDTQVHAALRRMQTTPPDLPPAA